MAAINSTSARMKPRAVRLFPLGLIAAAWVGIIFCSLYAIAVDGAAPIVAGGSVLCNTMGTRTSMISMQWTNASRLLVMAVLALQVWGLWQLRGIGAVLLKQPGISGELATAFRRLGHAVLAYGVFGLLVRTPVMHTPPNAMIYFSLERLPVPSLYLFVVACLCIYATAWLLGESARLKQENEEFI